MTVFSFGGGKTKVLSVCALVLAGFAQAQDADTSGEFRVESRDVAGGSQLLTVFGHLPGVESSPQVGEVPLLSVLRDTLGDGDPDNDQLRYVWILSSASPSLLQRAASAVPFFYWHAGASKKPGRPAPAFDMGQPARGVWAGGAAMLAQFAALDPRGSAVRASTRSFRNNYADHRLMHLFEGSAVLAKLDDEADSQRFLTSQERMAVQSRLNLAALPLGILVSEKRLPEAYMKQRARDDENRGHNWELLRQKAETDGLYFQPIKTGKTPALAMLSIASEDVRQQPARYDGQFLGFANPYNDEHLMHWSGYHSVQEGHDLIPLGLYSLEYPKVPFLVVDFRDTHGPKRREMFRRAATDTVSGVLGISMWSNWPVLAGFSSWNFIRGRHGAATDRTARIRAYSQTRQWLASDPTIEPELRSALLKHLEILGVNPLDDSIFKESTRARLQYAALLKYAADPHGLPAHVERDRTAELATYNHKFVMRGWFQFGHYATFGAYRHQEGSPASVLIALDEKRRVKHHVELLTKVADSAAQPSLVWNMQQVRTAIADLSASGFPERSSKLVERLMRQTSDQETHDLCEKALNGWGGYVQ